MSIRYSDPLPGGESEASAGSKGWTDDNATAESVIGLYQAELVGLGGPWRDVGAGEPAKMI